jgi:transcriptional regulator with XRE-family HTH domain
MPGSFGARLRQHREERNIALSAIAEQTKIKLSLLEALERDDLSRWPTGIYRRAYVRAYGQAIGLPETLVREFLEVHNDVSPEVIPALQAIDAAAEGSRSNGKMQMRFRDIVGAAIGSLSRRRRSPDESIAIAADPPHPSCDQLDERAAEELFVEAEPLPASTYGLEIGRGEPESPVELTLLEADDAGVEDPLPEAATLESAPAVAVQDPTPATSTETVVPFPDLSALAQVCTALGRVVAADEVQPLLQEAARILDGSGVIVWVWDPIAEELNPALSHGYSPRLIAQLPGVKREDENATAEAFRMEQICVVDGRGGPGALVVPMLTPWGCAGVIALELHGGNEHAAGVQAAARILAAVLAQLIGGEQPAHGESRTPAPPLDVQPVLRVVR